MLNLVTFEEESLSTKINPRAGSLALKALGYGTILCLSTASIITVSTCYALDISSVDVLNSKLKHSVGKGRDMLRSGLSPFLNSVDENVSYTLKQNSALQNRMPDFETTKKQLQDEKKEVLDSGISKALAEALYPEVSDT